MMRIYLMRTKPEEVKASTYARRAFPTFSVGRRRQLQVEVAMPECGGGTGSDRPLERALPGEIVPGVVNRTDSVDLARAFAQQVGLQVPEASARAFQEGARYTATEVELADDELFAYVGKGQGENPHLFGVSEDLQELTSLTSPRGSGLLIIGECPAGMKRLYADQGGWRDWKEILARFPRKPMTVAIAAGRVSLANLDKGSLSSTQG